MALLPAIILYCCSLSDRFQSFCDQAAEIGGYHSGITEVMPGSYLASIESENDDTSSNLVRMYDSAIALLTLAHHDQDLDTEKISRTFEPPETYSSCQLEFGRLWQDLGPSHFLVPVQLSLEYRPVDQNLSFILYSQRAYQGITKDLYIVDNSRLGGFHVTILPGELLTLAKALDFSFAGPCSMAAKLEYAAAPVSSKRLIAYPTSNNMPLRSDPALVRVAPVNRAIKDKVQLSKAISYIAQAVSGEQSCELKDQLEPKRAEISGYQIDPKRVRYDQQQLVRVRDVVDHPSCPDYRWSNLTMDKTDFEYINRPGLEPKHTLGNYPGICLRNRVSEESVHRPEVESEPNHTKASSQAEEVGSRGLSQTAASLEARATKAEGDLQLAQYKLKAAETDNHDLNHNVLVAEMKATKTEMEMQRVATSFRAAKTDNDDLIEKLASEERDHERTKGLLQAVEAQNHTLAQEMAEARKEANDNSKAIQEVEDKYPILAAWLDEVVRISEYSRDFHGSDKEKTSHIEGELSAAQVQTKCAQGSDAAQADRATERTAVGAAFPGVNGESPETIDSDEAKTSASISDADSVVELTTSPSTTSLSSRKEDGKSARDSGMTSSSSTHDDIQDDEVPIFQAIVSEKSQQSTVDGDYSSAMELEETPVSTGNEEIVKAGSLDTNAPSSLTNNDEGELPTSKATDISLPCTGDSDLISGLVPEAIASDIKASSPTADNSTKETTTEHHGSSTEETTTTSLVDEREDISVQHPVSELPKEEPTAAQNSEAYNGASQSDSDADLSEDVDFEDVNLEGLDPFGELVDENVVCDNDPPSTPDWNTLDEKINEDGQDVEINVEVADREDLKRSVSRISDGMSEEAKTTVVKGHSEDRDMDDVNEEVTPEATQDDSTDQDMNDGSQEAVEITPEENKHDQMMSDEFQVAVETTPEESKDDQEMSDGFREVIEIIPEDTKVDQEMSDGPQEAVETTPKGNEDDQEMGGLDPEPTTISQPEDMELDNETPEPALLGGFNVPTSTVPISTVPISTVPSYVPSMDFSGINAQSQQFENDMGSSGQATQQTPLDSTPLIPKLDFSFGNLRGTRDPTFNGINKAFDFNGLNGNIVSAFEVKKDDASHNADRTLTGSNLTLESPRSLPSTGSRWSTSKVDRESRQQIPSPGLRRKTNNKTAKQKEKSRHSTTSDDFLLPFAAAPSTLDYLNSSPDAAADKNEAIQQLSMSSEVTELAAELEQMFDAEEAADAEARMKDPEEAFLQAKMAQNETNAAVETEKLNPGPETNEGTQSESSKLAAEAATNILANDAAAVSSSIENGSSLPPSTNGSPKANKRGLATDGEMEVEDYPEPVCEEKAKKHKVKTGNEKDPVLKGGLTYEAVCQAIPRECGFSRVEVDMVINLT